MRLWKFLLSGTVAATAFAVQPALAGQGGKVVEVVTFKLKAGITAAEFATVDKAVEREHVAKQPGFVSRESAEIPEPCPRSGARCAAWSAMPSAA